MVVMRTVSKLGLAGVRLGYICGTQTCWNNLKSQATVQYQRIDGSGGAVCVGACAGV